MVFTFSPSEFKTVQCHVLTLCRNRPFRNEEQITRLVTGRRSGAAERASEKGPEWGLYKSRDSVVGIALATGWTTEVSEFASR
jgi:hypothetical protein